MGQGRDVDEGSRSRAEDLAIEVVDLGHQNRVRGEEKVVYEGEDYWTRPFDEPIPEEHMKELDELIGDGLASVTTGHDLTRSEDFGNKAGCFVSVRLTCNQDNESVARALEISEQIAIEAAANGQKRAQGVLDDLRGKAPEEPVRIVDESRVRRKKASKKKTGTKKTGRKKAPSNKTSTFSLGKGNHKPKFGEGDY